MRTIDFGGWPVDIHNSKDQQKRLESAAKAEVTPISVDGEEQRAVFFGSGKEPYQTTLTTCTCSDFRRRLPCKHIYRLAMELGEIEADFQIGESKGERLARQLAFEDAMQEIEKLSDAAQRHVCAMLDMCYHSIEHRQSAVPCMDESIAAELRGCKIMEEKGYPYHRAIWSMDKGEIYKHILDTGKECHLSRTAAKEKMLDWLAENLESVPEDFPQAASFAFIKPFDKAQKKTFDYLRYKYGEVDYSTT